MPFSSADLKRALEAGKRDRADGLWAIEARYIRAHDRIELDMQRGWKLGIDRGSIDELRPLLPRDLAELRLSPAGTTLHLDKHDVHISIEGLVASLMPNSFFSRVVGQKGGSATSKAKKLAARRNGRKGGRPRKHIRATASTAS
jgi:hypothetical protein